VPVAVGAQQAGAAAEAGSPTDPKVLERIPLPVPKLMTLFLIGDSQCAMVKGMAGVARWSLGEPLVDYVSSDGKRREVGLTSKKRNGGERRSAFSGKTRLAIG
jgi:hypothetical protein